MAMAMKSELVILIKGRIQNSKMGRLLRNEVVSPTCKFLLTLDAGKKYVEHESHIMKNMYKRVVEADMRKAKVQIELQPARGIKARKALVKLSS